MKRRLGTLYDPDLPKSIKNTPEKDKDTKLNKIPTEISIELNKLSNKVDDCIKQGNYNLALNEYVANCSRHTHEYPEVTNTEKKNLMKIIDNCDDIKNYLVKKLCYGELIKLYPSGVDPSGKDIECYQNYRKITIEYKRVKGGPVSAMEYIDFSIQEISDQDVIPDRSVTDDLFNIFFRKYVEMVKIISSADKRENRYMKSIKESTDESNLKCIQSINKSVEEILKNGKIKVTTREPFVIGLYEEYGGVLPSINISENLLKCMDDRITYLSGKNIPHNKIILMELFEVLYNNKIKALAVYHRDKISELEQSEYSEKEREKKKEEKIFYVS